MKKLILILFICLVNFEDVNAHQPKLIKYSPSSNEPHNVIDPEISKVYEHNLADASLKRVGKKLRFQFDAVKKLNHDITPIEILKQRKIFRGPAIVRNVYSEVLNVLQAVVINKLSKKKLNKHAKNELNDALMTSIAGISAAIKNTG